MELTLAAPGGLARRGPALPRPQTLLALIRAVTLATFAAAEVALPSRVLGAAALYVVGACVLGNLRPKWRDLDPVMLIVIVCGDIAWCTAAFVYFGPEQSLPAVLYAALVGAVVASVSGWTAIAVGLSTALVYALSMLFARRDIPLTPAGTHLVVFQALVMALSGTLSGCLADQWRRLSRARETVGQLQRLNEVQGEKVVSEGDPHMVFRAAAQAALRIFGAPRAWVMVPADGEQRALVLEAYAGFEPPERRETITPGRSGVAGSVWETGNALLLGPRKHAWAKLSALESQLSLGQLVAAPVAGEGGPVAVLLVSRTAEAASFSGEDLAVLALLARTVSTCLQVAGLIRDLHLSSTTDSLTGLYNHGVFLTKLAEHVQRARESGDELSLIVLDMDGFKQINDSAGHWEGNRVLRALADALRQTCRDTDVIARCGGDEFAVLLPAVGPEGAAAVAQRTAAVLREAATRPGVRAPISASYGIASYPWDAPTDEALFRQADDRLYEAKKAGGNHLAFDPAVVGVEDGTSCVRPAGEPLQRAPAPSPAG